MKSVVDFDHHSRHYAQNWVSVGRQLREQTPVAWSESHGGFWVLSRYEDCERAAREWRTFSSENDIRGTGNGGKGILIPRNRFQFALSESDPPQASDIRRLETPYFLPRNVAQWETIARQYADEALAAVVHSGKIDFVEDLCVPVAAKTAMHLVGVPLTEWKVFAFSAHEASYLPNTHPDYPHDKIAHVQQMILELVRERRARPLEDVISAIMRGQVNDLPVSDEMGVGIVSALVFAGFDTVSTLMLNALNYLDDHAQLRPVLLEGPAKINAALEEWLRLFPPGHSLARTVVQDIELNGQRLVRGDRVLMLWAAANRDPAKFERPDEFWLERPNAGLHLTFSAGQHRCLGSLIAKMESRVVLETVLRRIGDYRLERDQLQRYDVIGHIDGYIAMPAVFTAQH